MRTMRTMERRRTGICESEIGQRRKGKRSLWLWRVSDSSAEDMDERATVLCRNGGLLLHDAKPNS